MSGRKQKMNGTRIAAGALIEGLESRQLLSSYGSLVLAPNIILGRADTTAAQAGYSPSQIRQAYGVDQISFASGGVTANGSGQTIAIVDAYNDPNIAAADLKTFDSTFGIKRTAQLPGREPGREARASCRRLTPAGPAKSRFDVEWVCDRTRAAAKIILVEANSATLDDLMTAVNYARHASGVSAISMSWGGSEFFRLDGNGEFTGETQFDPNFTTPTGHEGITFVAAAGDSGSSFSGHRMARRLAQRALRRRHQPLRQLRRIIQHRILLEREPAAGTARSKPSPATKTSCRPPGARSTPDVSIVGDPNTGVAVYDSRPEQGLSGWQEVGGSSAGAPMWSALVAIANQGRLLAGQSTLDGASQTLPILYGLYTVANYDNSFNDVVDAGSSNPWHWRWGFGGSGNPATLGYDTATGLGTPKSAAIVDALIGTSGSNTGSTGTGSPGTGSTGSTTTTPAQLPASPLSGVFLSSPPDSVMGGTAGSVRLRISNDSRATFDGPSYFINLYLSTDGSATSSDTLLTTMSIPALNLKAGASKTVKLKFTYPTTLNNGGYFLTAAIDATKTDTANATVATAKTLSVSKQTVDLATVFSNGPAVSVTPGASDTASVTIENLGNVNAVGTVNLNLGESPWTGPFGHLGRSASSGKPVRSED